MRVRVRVSKSESEREKEREREREREILTKTIAVITTILQGTNVIIIISFLYCFKNKPRMARVSAARNAQNIYKGEVLMF